MSHPGHDHTPKTNNSSCQAFATLLKKAFGLKPSENVACVKTTSRNAHFTYCVCDVNDLYRGALESNLALCTNAAQRQAWKQFVLRHV